MCGTLWNLALLLALPGIIRGTDDVKNRRAPFLRLNNTITQVQEDVSKCLQFVTALQSDLADEKNNIEVLQSEDTALKERVQTLENKNEDNLKDIQALQEENAELKYHLSATESELKARLTATENNIGAIQTKLSRSLCLSGEVHIYSANPRLYVDPNKSVTHIKFDRRFDWIPVVSVGISHLDVGSATNTRVVCYATDIAQDSLLFVSHGTTARCMGLPRHGLLVDSLALNGLTHVL